MAGSYKSINHHSRRAQKSLLEQQDEDEVGQEEEKSITLDKVEKIIEKHGLELETEEKGKRIYRKTKEELFDSNADPKAEINRLTKMIPIRVSITHRDLFNKCAEEFPTKRAALERAIELLEQDLE